MDIKTELKNYIIERLEPKASPIFMNKALAVIEEAADDKGSLTDAANKVGKMVSLFIKKDLGKEIYEELKVMIEKAIH